MTMRVTEKTKELLEGIKDSYGFQSLVDEAVQYSLEYGNPIRNKLYGWIRELTKGQVGSWVRYKESEKSIKAYLYSNSGKRYYIVASKQGSYLGCQYSSLIDGGWGSGGDLSDGKFCPETWEAIKSDIIWKELSEVPKVAFECCEMCQYYRDQELGEYGCMLTGARAWKDDPQCSSFKPI